MTPLLPLTLPTFLYRIAIITLVSLFLSQPLQATEKIQVDTGSDPYQLLQSIDQSVAGLEVPHFFRFQWDARDEKFEIFRGTDLDAFALAESTNLTKLRHWNHCGDVGLYYVNYPQYTNNGKIEFYMKHELLIRKNGRLTSRISVPEIDKFEANVQINFSGNCTSAYMSVKNSLYHINLNDSPKLEMLPFPVVDASEAFEIAPDVLAISRPKDNAVELALVSVSRARPDVILDSARHGIEFESFNGGQLCWIADRDHYQQPIFKCWSQSSGIRSTQIKIETEKDSVFTWKIASPHYLIATRPEPSFVSYLVRIEDSKIVFSSRAHFVMMNDHTIAELQHYGVGDSKLRLYDLRSQSGRNFLYDFMPNGDVVGLTALNGTVTVVTQNQYKQKSFFVFNEQGLITPPFKFPNFTPQTQLQLVKLRARDGFENYSYLITSTSQANPVKAAAVFVHGGGCHNVLPIKQSMLTSTEVLELARKGIPVLSITYRNDLLPGRESTAKPRTAENCGIEEMHDIESASQYLRSLYPEASLYLWGRSHGGYLANVMATQDSRINLFKGVISEVGVWSSDFGHDFINWAKNHFNKQRDPILHFANLKTPMFMYIGQKDIAAAYEKQAKPVLQQMQLQSTTDSGDYQMFKHPTKPLTALVARDEEHSIKKHKTHERFIKSILDFIQSNP